VIRALATTLTDGVSRVAKSLLDPDFDPDQERLAQAQAEHRAALVALALAMIRAQRAREEGDR